jgi:ADP-ribose pyrophosphatase YjhB (NUDIX family)
MRPGETNTMPQPPTHYVGCGGIVINAHNEVLLVQERQGYKKGTFNIPSGRADLGETIEQTAVREVFEETGLRTKCIDLVGLREVQNTLFGKPDLYFLFLLKLDGEE